MKEKDAFVLKHKVGFLHPQAICEARHLGVVWWKDDHDELKMCQTRKEKQVKQRECHKEIVKRVAAYISLQMT
jgi:hypothetical protein